MERAPRTTTLLLKRAPRTTTLRAHRPRPHRQPPRPRQHQTATQTTARRRATRTARNRGPRRAPLAQSKPQRPHLHPRMTMTPRVANKPTAPVLMPLMTARTRQMALQATTKATQLLPWTVRRMRRKQTLTPHPRRRRHRKPRQGTQSSQALRQWTQARRRCQTRHQRRRRRRCQPWHLHKSTLSLKTMVTPGLMRLRLVQARTPRAEVPKSPMLPHPKRQRPSLPRHKPLQIRTQATRLLLAWRR